MSATRVFLLTGMGVFALWFLGFGLFCYDAATMVPALPSQERADAIVVLTGGAGRLSTGLRLLKQKKGQRLLISGVHPDVRPQELLPSQDLPVDLGYAAKNTLENAREARIWADRHGFKSLLVVTSRTHMRRSLLEFSQRLGDIRLFAYPVPGEMSQEFLVRPAWSQYKKYTLALGRAVLRSAALQLGFR